MNKKTLFLILSLMLLVIIIVMTEFQFDLTKRLIKKNKNVLHQPAEIIKNEQPTMTGSACDAEFPQSDYIKTAYAETNPITIKPSWGDLWFSTWADDDNLYVSWGDGEGFGNVWTDIGIGKLTGNVPKVKTEIQHIDPQATKQKNISKNSLTQDEIDVYKNDKPSSLLFFDGRLYAQFHSPLGDADIGYLAYSNDYGKNWIRLRQNSPWTKFISDDPKEEKSKSSNFRCMFFINMGKNYSLNTDGYVYAYGIGREWDWNKGIYLTRVKKENILNYNAYEYFVGLNNNEVTWSNLQDKAKALPGINSTSQFSAIYHSEINRYLIMTESHLFEAPTPWGPWACISKWRRKGWIGYQPGIVSKNLGSDYFWFTMAGQRGGEMDVDYRLNFGKIKLELY